MNGTIHRSVYAIHERPAILEEGRKLDSNGIWEMDGLISLRSSALQLWVKILIICFQEDTFERAKWPSFVYSMKTGGIGKICCCRHRHIGHRTSQSFHADPCHGRTSAKPITICLAHDPHQSIGLLSVTPHQRHDEYDFNYLRIPWQLPIQWPIRTLFPPHPSRKRHSTLLASPPQSTVLRN